MKAMTMTQGLILIKLIDLSKTRTPRQFKSRPPPGHLTAKPGILAEMVGISAAAFLTAYALGWFAGAKKEWPDRMTVAISATWTNVGLAVVLANEFFREAMPLVVLFTVTASISWNATLVPGQWLASRFDDATAGPAQADGGGRSRHTD